MGAFSHLSGHLPLESPGEEGGVWMAGKQNCPIHATPECFEPALDPIVAKAYDGYCTKLEYPYVRIIPKGWKPGA